MIYITRRDYWAIALITALLLSIVLWTLITSNHEMSTRNTEATAMYSGEGGSCVNVTIDGIPYCALEVDEEINLDDGVDFLGIRFVRVPGVDWLPRRHN